MNSAYTSIYDFSETDEVADGIFSLAKRTLQKIEYEDALEFVKQQMPDYGVTITHNTTDALYRYLHNR